MVMCLHVLERYVYYAVKLVKRRHRLARVSEPDPFIDKFCAVPIIHANRMKSLTLGTFVSRGN